MSEEAPKDGLAPAADSADHADSAALTLREGEVAPKRKSLAEILEALPAAPGVYIMKDHRGKPVYIGKAAVLRNRVRQYFQPASGDSRDFVPLLEGIVTDIETVITSNEKEALLLENTLIKKHQPRFNVNLKDDKNYLVLRLDPQAEWPRLEVVRKLGDDGAFYFGPYHSATSCREALRVVNRHFQLRTCTDHVLHNRRRPCLQYQIKRCTAPCVGYVDEAVYAEQVRQANAFLAGRSGAVQERFKEAMSAAAERLDFEDAAKWRDRPISDRVAGFLINAQQAAKAAGHDIQINVNQISPRQWMIPTFSVDVVENTTRKLPAGLALNGRQGPDGRAFSSRGGGGGVGGAFYPVVGLSAPSMDSAPGGRASPAPDGSPRVLFNLGDPTTIDFNYRLRKFTAGRPMATFAERAATLRAFAATEVGEAQADNLMDYWNNLNDVSDILNVLDFGGMLKFGHVLNRWVSRPMVPFPEKLTDADKADYRPYLFQAKGEDQANNLIDIQAMRMYEGWGAKMLFQRDIELALPKVERNIRLAEGFKAAATTDAGKAQWDLTAKRLQALVYLLESADDMVDYQAQLDRVKVLGVKPEANPPLAAQSSWDRTDLMDTARKEIDIMVSLERLLASTDAPILDLASSPQDETIQKLGPNLRAQIRHKVDIMNHHWRDYDQLFTVPNP